LNLKNKRTIFREILGYLVVAVIAVLFAVVLRIFVIEPYKVPSPSMSPTLLVGDRVIVNKLKYKFDSIKRGDLVAIYSPIENKNLVKRVVALPGEKVDLTENGKIYIDDVLLEEDYIPEDIYPSYEDSSFIVEKGKYFVMGDNRNNSADSRVFGTIGLDSIFGKVVFIYGPVSRIGVVN